jgi:hypothetical protein
MITREKLKIFDSYAGDIDGLARCGNDFEKQLFEDNEWSIIDNLYQDIELINKKLVAKSYLDKTLITLKENCNQESYSILIAKIIF